MSPRRLLLLCLAVLVVVAPATSASARPASSTESAAPSVNWQQVSAGGEHTCARKVAGRVLCWGGNFFGQLGIGSSGEDADRVTPVPVAGAVAEWSALSAGSIHTCAVSTEPRLYCWGDNFYGQLGTGGSLQPQPTPQEVDGALTDWTLVDVGGQHSCAIRAPGSLYCWGLDFFGQVGDGPGGDGDQPVPVEVAGAFTDWSAVSAGQEHTCGLQATGRLFCWGRNSHGQLGDGSEVDRDAPVEVAGGDADWAAVSAGNRHTCAVKTSGRLFCWGADSRGVLGNGGAITGDQPAPVEVAGAAVDWVEVSAGTSATCGRRAYGRLFCWGSDADGRLGNGGANVDRLRPVEVAGAVTGWRSVSVGDFHACATKATGRAFCWGRDRDGQLGNGLPRTYRDVPVAVT